MSKHIPTDMTLRTEPGPFRAVWRGIKKAELRENDRDFQVGDRVTLIEFDPKEARWAHPYRAIIVEITHVLPGGRFGLPGNLCMFSFTILRRTKGAGNACESCGRGSKEAKS